MRGRALATASLSRDYGLKTGFAPGRRPWRRRGRSPLSGMKRLALPKSLRSLPRSHWLWPVGAAAKPGPQGESQGREFQRQAGAAAVCLRLHRRGLPQGSARPGQGPEPGQPRGISARALHQQPRERGGHRQLSVEASERARADRGAHATGAAERKVVARIGPAGGGSARPRPPPLQPRIRVVPSNRARLRQSKARVQGHSAGGRGRPSCRRPRRATAAAAAETVRHFRLIGGGAASGLRRRLLGFLAAALADTAGGLRLEERLGGSRRRLGSRLPRLPRGGRSRPRRGPAARPRRRFAPR